MKGGDEIVKAKVEQAVKMVRAMNKKELHLFVFELMGLADVVEDIYDIAELRRTRSEHSRPYEDVVKDLKTKGRL